MKEIKVPIREFNWLILFATRYAMGRESTAPSIMADLIKQNKKYLTEQTKNSIIEEIEFCKDTECLGKDCDITTWEDLVKELEEGNRDEFKQIIKKKN